MALIDSDGVWVGRGEPVVWLVPDDGGEPVELGRVLEVKVVADAPVRFVPPEELPD